MKTDLEQPAKCDLCGEPMPVGEEMFRYHGYSGPCPRKPSYRVLDKTAFNALPHDDRWRVFRDLQELYLRRDGSLADLKSALANAVGVLNRTSLHSNDFEFLRHARSVLEAFRED